MIGDEFYISDPPPYNRSPSPLLRGAGSVNTSDAGVVITTMQSMWPAHSWREGEAARLVEHLLSHEFNDVIATVGVLERTTRFWPHWSEMSDVLMSIMRRRREAVEVESELGDPPVSAERAREYIAECRAIVAGWNPQAPLRQALERGWS